MASMVYVKLKTEVRFRIQIMPTVRFARSHMPIRPAFRALYPPDLPALSRHVRFGRAGGRCQRCHMLQDRPFHLLQRWLTYRRRWAIGDLFLGSFAGGGEILR